MTIKKPDWDDPGAHDKHDAPKHEAHGHGGTVKIRCTTMMRPHVDATRTLALDEEADVPKEVADNLIKNGFAVLVDKAEKAEK